MATLVEKYAPRIAISEQVYKRAHCNEGMDSNKKLVIATCLDNTKRLLKEAFSAADGTQKSAMGDFAKFCLNLNTVVLPNLIAHDLVIVHPMTRMSGNVAYVRYTTSITKGAVAGGTELNSPFKLSNVDSSYTSQATTDTFATGQTVLGWTPCIKHVFQIPVGGSVVTAIDADVKVVRGTTVYYGTFAAGSEATGTLASMTFVDATGAAATPTLTAGDKIAYKYDNEIIPQEKIPGIKAEVKNIPLYAQPRRISIYYSQLAAFEAHTDYGFELGDQLSEKAVGELSYEIDTEIVEFLDKMAGAANSDLVWSKTLPVGVDKMAHYAGFAEILEIGKQIIYDRTQRFAPNWMLIASNILPVLAMIPAFKPANAGQINGPYMAGTFNGVKVFVSPKLAAGRYVLGVNGDDMMSAAAVYAPYMPIVPTQLVQMPDGGSMQGWATMYDLKALNTDLVVAGEVTA